MQTITRNPGYVLVEGAQTDLGAAMFNAAATFAIEAGMPHDTDRDIIVASRQPVSMASAFADLCNELGVPVPRFVRLALDT